MTGTVASSAPSRRAWIGVGVVWVGSLAALVVWLLGTSTGQLREQLKWLQFWSLDACVLLGVLFGLPVLSRVRHDLQKGDVARMALLTALAVTLTLWVAPRTNRIFYDEQIYQGVGQNLADLRLAQVCHDGSVESGRLRCASGEYNKQPYAWPHALSLAYRLLGVREGTAFAVNAAVMGLTAGTVYLLVFVWFRDRDAALFAGLLIVLMPEQVMWSATAAVEPSASLACVVALLSAAHYVRAGGLAALGASVVAAAYAMQFRPESFLILPIVGLVVWPRLGLDLQRPRGWWAAILFLWLAAVHAAHLYAVRHLDWGTGGAPRFSIEYVASNLRVNGWFYLTDERFPAAFTLFALAGLALGRYERERLWMALYFLLFFGIDLAFYAGSYNYGADVRYSLLTYPSLAVLGGLGVAHIVRTVRRVAPRVPVLTAAVAVLGFQFLWYAPVVRATPEEAWAARADVRFARLVATGLPPDTYVMTHNPSMFHTWGIDAGQMAHVVSNRAYFRLLAERHAGGVYLHWNFWCNVDDPAQQEVCRTALASAPAQVVTEHRERDQWYAFYRMKIAN